jgi:non-ribosomal peptide synthetase component F
MTEWTHATVSADIFKENDTVAQIAGCSFDVHALDIMGMLIIGGTLIMIRPGGILDFEYLASVFKKNQITYVQIVPSLLQAFFTFIMEAGNSTDVASLRSLCASG